MYRYIHVYYHLKSQFESNVEFKLERGEFECQLLHFLKPEVNKKEVLELFWIDINLIGENIEPLVNIKKWRKFIYEHYLIKWRGFNKFLRSVIMTWDNF